MEFNATFIISIISFVIFVIIMNFIFYKPLEKIVSEREKFIEDNFDDAKMNNSNAQKITEVYSKKIEETNSQCKVILSEKSQNAKLKREELISEAQKKSSEEILNNKNELSRASQDTKEVLKSEVVNLASLMTNKLFGGKAVLDNIDKNTVNQLMDKG